MSAPREDFYAVLQVQPDAEPEVIEAAYRQLMRKYHPDSAGADRERAAILHERAKTINRAYAVLRDSKLRWIYDRSPTRWGGAAPPRQPHSAADASQAARSAPPGARTSQPPAGSGEGARTQAATVAPGPKSWTAYLGKLSPLFDAVSTVYYFLPGPYEWERERSNDLLTTLMLPFLGVAGWSLASGRLNWLTGRAPYTGMLAWGLLAVLALPLWPTLPRLLLAGLPTVLLQTGPVEGLLRQAAVPAVLAWLAAGLFSALLSARLYLFAVLPTVVICSTLANGGPGQALWSVLAGVGASVSTGTLGLLTLACVLGVLSWLTVIDWRRQGHPARPRPRSSSSASVPPEPAAGAPTKPLFRRISADRVRTLQVVPLRTDRDHREAPSVMLAAKQEANVVLVRDPWAFLQTDDGREGWAEWRVTR